MFHLLLLNSDGMRSEMNILREVVQCGTFAVKLKGAILVTKIFFQQGLSRAQQPEMSKRKEQFR